MHTTISGNSLNTHNNCKWYLQHPRSRLAAGRLVAQGKMDASSSNAASCALPEAASEAPTKQPLTDALRKSWGKGRMSATAVQDIAERAMGQGARATQRGEAARSERQAREGKIRLRLDERVAQGCGDVGYTSSDGRTRTSSSGGVRTNTTMDDVARVSGGGRGAGPTRQ